MEVTAYRSQYKNGTGISYPTLRVSVFPLSSADIFGQHVVWRGSTRYEDGCILSEYTVQENGVGVKLVIPDTASIGQWNLRDRVVDYNSSKDQQILDLSASGAGSSLTGWPHYPSGNGGGPMGIRPAMWLDYSEYEAEEIDP